MKHWEMLATRNNHAFFFLGPAPGESKAFYSSKDHKPYSLDPISNEYYLGYEEFHTYISKHFANTRKPHFYHFPVWQISWWKAKRRDFILERGTPSPVVKKWDKILAQVSPILPHSHLPHRSLSPTFGSLWKCILSAPHETCSIYLPVPEILLSWQLTISHFQHQERKQFLALLLIIL